MNDPGCFSLHFFESLETESLAEKKYFKFKENFRCKHLQTYSLSLFLSLCVLSPPLSTTLTLSLSVCALWWMLLSPALRTTMNMQCDPLSIPVGGNSASSPPQGGRRSEFGLRHRAAQPGGWCTLTTLLNGCQPALNQSEIGIQAQWWYGLCFGLPASVYTDLN